MVPWPTLTLQVIHESDITGIHSEDVKQQQKQDRKLSLSETPARGKCGHASIPRVLLPLFP